MHPNAIHELRAVMNELSEKHQVVLTTHCPLFVDRATVSNNIIVQDKKARPAKRIQEIRDILGVRASDNLRHAELVLLVEGDDDAGSLKSLLSWASRSLKSAIDNGTLAIESLGGGSNLSYKAGLIRDSLCLAHCFLDDDRSGHSSFEKAKLQGLLTEADANFSICPGMKEAELEDFYDPNIYEDVIRNTYRVTLQSSKFKTNKKWSERMREVFRQQGKRWNDQVEKELKGKISEVIAATPENALISNKRASFDGLVSALEQRLHELPKGRSN